MQRSTAAKAAPFPSVQCSRFNFTVLAADSARPPTAASGRTPCSLAHCPPPALAAAAGSSPVRASGPCRRSRALQPGPLELQNSSKVLLQRWQLQRGHNSCRAEAQGFACLWPQMGCAWLPCSMQHQRRCPECGRCRASCCCPQRPPAQQESTPRLQHTSPCPPVCRPQKHRCCLLRLQKRQGRRSARTVAPGTGRQLAPQLLMQAGRHPTVAHHQTANTWSRSCALWGPPFCLRRCKAGAPCWLRETNWARKGWRATLCAQTTIEGALAGVAGRLLGKRKQLPLLS